MTRSPVSRILWSAPLVLVILGVLGLSLPSSATTLVAGDSWGAVPKYIAIHPGTTVSVWNIASRAQITGGAAAMTPVGDGTYEYIVGLTAGQSYNYLFYANPGATSIQGLQAYNEYYDVVPTTGNIRCGRLAPVYNDTSAYYSSVSYDARRVLTVPSNMNPGDTLWVFNNWGETPGAIAGFSGHGEGNNSIRLDWTGVYGFWGSGGESFKAADVMAGGSVEIYRSNSPLTGYALRDTSPAASLTYLDTGLGAGTYYYMVRAIDAYRGLGYGATDSYYTLHGGSDSPVVNTYIQCTTALAVRSFFIVQGGDWDYIQEHNGRAWFSQEGTPPWGEKFAATIVQITIPAQPEPQRERSLNPEQATASGAAEPPPVHPSSPHTSS